MNNNNELMDKKTYATFDKTYMIFGSIMNNMQGKLRDERDIELYWELAKKLNSEFVDELYKGLASNSAGEQPL